ncbi:MAG: transglycosylase SLT domain-containing protein, partial [Gammaproteobacteria bacterium]|nr:transglycosylase SLT domain-containing protein [Gammaproteobacteria bacterium]
NKQHFTITKKAADTPSTKELTADREAIQKLERRLALKLVFEDESDAYERLGQLDKKNNSSRTWRVRIALAEQNWPNVLTAIQDLSNTEKADERWQYWLARAYTETGKVEMAQPLLTELSGKRSFYGFLAADKVNSIYQLAENPIKVTAEEITALKNQREFRVAFELMVLDRKNDAKLQWWHATRQLNKKEIIIAAKLAQQWQWHEIAIFTIAKAKHWDDIELRFPLSYADKILENSIQQKLNPAILFGLVRRESAFNEKAYSPVGARGLMQIMPSTGRSIARNLNERWHGSDSLYNPVTNLKYGAFYYQKLLNQFDGNYAIALAAYNAGPQRVKKWLPETLAMPADIWIETIPYKETREYVTNVLAYVLIYQQRAQLDGSTEDSVAENSLSMNDLTRDVLPLTAIP